MADPSSQARPLHGVDDVVDVVTRYAWPRSGPDRFGMEIECFVFDSAGSRLPLDGPVSARGIVSAAGFAPAGDGTFTTTSGGRLTFEPGAQVEYSTPATASTGELFADARSVWQALTAAADGVGARLVPTGMDPWRRGVDVPQQLDRPRYRAMARYLSRRSPIAGPDMMRNTAALQVSVEAGNGAERGERWEAANRLSPLLTAAFASSPGAGLRSRRAHTWQRVDPTRTGFPSWAYAVDPVEDTVRLALDADVMFAMRDGEAVVGRPGWKFRHWIGHPPADLGPPTEDDLVTHLTTLFPEVRPRGGALELRGIDAIPPRWWPAPVAIVAGALYHADTRGAVLERLRDLEPGDSWHAAARDGLAVPDLGKLAIDVFELAVDGAARVPGIDPATRSAAARYVDRYTRVGVMPSDELDTLRSAPAALFDWVEAPTDDRSMKDTA